MLYVTTRVGQDAFTAFRALSENRGPEGGFFVPMQFPLFDEKRIADLAGKTFSQNLADVVNLFFGTQINGPDLELSIGRYPVEFIVLNGKITVANTWHNPSCKFGHLVRGVKVALCKSNQSAEDLSNWLILATRIGVLFGIFGLLQKKGVLSANRKVDIAIPEGDLSLLMAAWYARKMGLPIGTIVCCCNENNGFWNLLHKGELRTDVSAFQTHTPACDYTVPVNLERLIFATLGFEETARFCEICRTGGIYTLEAEQLAQLREGIHVSVVSGKKMASTIPNLYSTTGFIADPYTALAYSGLIDYRAATGSSRQALIVSEEGPYFHLDFLSQCMNVTPSELSDLLK